MFVNMDFSDNDKILIKYLYKLKGYKATELMNEFSSKWWTQISINRLLKILRDTGTDSQVASDYEVPYGRKCWPG